LALPVDAAKLPQMKLCRILKWFVVLALCLAPLAGARAQSTAPAASTSAAAPAAAAPSVAQLQQLVATLKDDKARAQLIDQLQALIAAQNGMEQTAPASPLTWLSNFPSEIDAIGSEVLAAVPVFLQLPHAARWFEQQIGEPSLRDHWIGIFEKLGTILGAGLAAAIIVRLLSRGAAQRLTRNSHERWLMRIMLLGCGAVAEALPAFAFAAAILFATPLTEPNTGTHGVASVTAVTAVWVCGLLAMARVLLLAPAAQALYSISEETCNYLYIWIRRFAYAAAIGYAASTGAWWLNAPSAIVGLLIRLSVLVLAILAVIFVLQNRGAVAGWLRGSADSGRGGWRTARGRLAETWHLLAIVYIVGTFGVFMLNSEGGLSLLLRATALSLVVVTTAAMLVRFMEQALRRGFAVNQDLRTRFPTLEARANRYMPILQGIASFVIYALAVLALMQAWGLSAFAWLQATADSRIAGSALGIAIAIAAAIIAWEGFVSLLERYVQRLENDSRRRARARTLFPLLRLIMMIVLAVIVGFVVLGEIGINLGALIAGAGIFGLIAGLGLQPLLQDFLTSISVLVDDTFAVGDVIDVGNNHSGVVEAMSIRAVKLRAFDGSLQTVPFSEVKVIQNLTKDYSYYVANIGIAYREDTDKVTKVLVEVADQMRQEPAFGAVMLAPLEVIGVDRFEDSAVIIIVRLKTLPIHQWRIGREFNRRFKKAFDENGIEIPFPQRVIYFGDDSGDEVTKTAVTGDAAAARAALERPKRATIEPAD
jgi:moderate conductance mechanosensitive channel